MALDRQRYMWSCVLRFPSGAWRLLPSLDNLKWANMDAFFARCRAGHGMPELDESSVDVPEHVFDDSESAAYRGEAEHVT
jgi:hypothetical protein